MELSVNENTIQEAKERMLTMDEYIYLFYGIQMIELELAVNLPKLIRLGYIDQYMVFTEKCYELIPDAEAPQVYRFEEFWESYPKDDQCYNHQKTRTLRVNKPATRQEYIRVAALHGEDFIIDCLVREVDDRLSQSITKNTFKFMRNSVNYLKTKQFLDYA